MGETEYPNSLIYLTVELCICSKTLRRNIIEDNSCQYLTNGKVLPRVDSPLHFRT
ncbi:hypothetical protein BHE74_00059530 [Ensete ventricosum]|nr:hypothetical protein BHE74_00059530 [Ensete ventricosum]RZS18655.1 hypothetical protein BHM03_00050968 [Ensete ventricosum]